MTHWESICTLFLLDPDLFIRPIHVLNINELLVNHYFHFINVTHFSKPSMSLEFTINNNKITDIVIYVITMNGNNGTSSEKRFISVNQNLCNYVFNLLMMYFKTNV